jgi:transcriptional regulator with XRE-family HTH domain
MTSTPNLVRNLAANLKTLLAETGLSQRELAQRANIDPMALNNAVNGKSMLSTVNLYRLSLALDRPMNWLVSDQAAGQAEHRKTNGSAA